MKALRNWFWILVVFLFITELILYPLRRAWAWVCESTNGKE
jgi:hypothetical protein